MQNLEIVKDSKTALLFGVESLVGKICLNKLLENSAYRKVHIFVTKKIEMEHPKLEIHLFQPESMEKWMNKVAGDDLYCCYQVSSSKRIHLREPNRIYFPRIYQIAHIGAANGVNQFFFLSSVFANRESLFSLGKVMGSLERAILRLKYWSVHIFQPSFVFGEISEQNWGETVAKELGKGLDFITAGFLTKYKPIEAEVVASAMVESAQYLREGVFYYPSENLQHWSENRKSENLISISNKR